MLPEALLSEALAHDDPRVRRRGDPSAARRTLELFTPGDPERIAERDRILAFLDEHPYALERSCVPGHLTAAALLIDARGERALLTLHAKLGRWLQLGGHCDGDGNLLAAALREAQEESGIEQLRIHPAPIDVDVHVIPARRDEPEHLHLDVRFVAFAPAGAREVCSKESTELRWFSREEAYAAAIEPSVLRLFDLAFGSGRVAAGSPRPV